ncbi:MAG TPA: hypothetical protein VM370_04940 [Candidatus Thermoplasmatota archaeon]|nr:hypothetical protein [Candidatus Thermoplasmatota archaeon]
METVNSSETQAKKTELVLVKDTNEWGQIVDLEKNATYFVIRKPTKELTQQKSKEFVSDVRAFLHEHRVLSEKQFDELNTRYGEPAKAKAKELRDTMEKKFDEISKEFEARVEQLEGEYKARFGKKDETTPSAPGETPGEMPHGGEHAPAGASTSSPKATKKPKTS